MGKSSRGLFDSYNIRRDQIQLELDIQDLNLDVDTVMPIGLIVNELVSNSLKYAFPDGRAGRIQVRLIEEKQKLQLQVIDDGIGMSPENIDEIGSSFGYRLIQVFKDQMEAYLHINGAEGTTVTLTISKYEMA